MGQDSTFGRTLLGDASDHPISRRSLLRVAALGAGAVAVGGSLSGCVGSLTTAAATGTLVRIWDLFSGSDGAIMQDMLNTSRQELPQYDIRSVTLAWGSPYYTKLAMASAGGRAPETAVMHLSRLIGYAPGGLLEPFDLDMLEQVGITESDFAPALWERALYNDELYALPLDTHPFITLFNPAIAEPAGILDANGKLAPISTPDEFLDMGRKLAEVTGETGVAFGYLSDPAQAWRLFWGLYGQSGAEYSLVPGKKAELDDGVAVELLTFMQTMLDGTVAAKNSDYGGAISSFVSGRAGLILTGEWELRALREAFPDVGGAPLPIMFGTEAAYADSHSYVLPRQLTPNPARREATYEVLASILKGAQTWATAGHIPAFQPVVETPEYAALEPQADYAIAGRWAFLDPPTWFTGSGSDFQNRMCQAMSSTLQGLAPPAQAVDQMISEMNLLLSMPSPA
ncbi:MAG: extracellular solute-binding protein [Actinomycetales bacterium]|nr:extracellular solute-binding protein [Actinomycetales bacterium]